MTQSNNIEPIYRKLIHMVDVIQEGDQFYGFSNTWRKVIINIGEFYDSRFMLPHRRIDIRKTNLNDLLYGDHK